MFKIGKSLFLQGDVSNYSTILPVTWYCGNLWDSIVGKLWWNRFPLSNRAEEKCFPMQENFELELGLRMLFGLVEDWVGFWRLDWITIFDWPWIGLGLMKPKFWPIQYFSKIWALHKYFGSSHFCSIVLMLCLSYYRSNLGFLIKSCLYWH